jgi:hypothetical protein
VLAALVQDQFGGSRANSAVGSAILAAELGLAPRKWRAPDALGGVPGHEAEAVHEGI